MREYIVSSKKEQELKARMQGLGIHEDDLVEKFILSSGAGGQKVNKTSNCVYLKHMPTGFEVKCQAGRSRALNRFLARRLLADKIADKITTEISKKKEKINKIKRQKKRRSRRTKEKILELKKINAEKKKNRAYGKKLKTNDID